MIAAIEIYNKPTFEYRDECAVILLLNAWELALKALLSKNKKSIYYPKERYKPYQTLSWRDALPKAESLFPTSIARLPVQRNLEALGNYRNNVIHFYNDKNFGVVLYALAQTSIKNFRDFLQASFGVRLEDDINWEVLPIGISPPIDPVSYLSGKSNVKMTTPVRQFLSELARTTEELKGADEDTGRLLTIFKVKLESVKKIGEADVVVGVEKGTESEEQLAIERKQDPNKSHPLRQTEILQKIPTLHGDQFTSHVFQAIIWKYDIKKQSQFCWQASEGVLTRYSNDMVVFIKRLTANQLEEALRDYKNYRKSSRVKSKK